MTEKDKETQIEENVENETTNEEQEIEEKVDEINQVEELKKELNIITEEKDKLYDRLIRIQAEFDNFKKRTQKEKVAERKYKSEDLATELLPALDNFERALHIEDVNDEIKGFLDGMSMIYRQLIDVLEGQEITKIETVGKKFDPNLHHAVMQVEDDTVDSDVIVEELQKGYMLADRVIRPAMVKVNK
ncbi:nucleotide exchange factor GrpE [Cerasibacillus terrae]|uniref:Protein GrpE n=1 Tax=Cerasibacillus terrae TaxID=2498845 RepID=A0A5C8P3V4_9BACI|nr:nucleotide exchange factor GrpE [Cerasibacillus terrae]TXL68022.1 nucleotide exchange factor GrpE [Cerasibacillus terrae]